MNVFIIPSWYPSVTDALPGIFFREQATALASQYKDSNFCLSTWGQNDDRLLLWIRQPFRSITKLFLKPKTYTRWLDENLVEYFTPAYTWSIKFRNGNFNQILQANQSNLYRFEKAKGKVDIIHAHVGYPAGYIAKKLSEIHDIPFVITEHMSPFPHAQFLSRKNELVQYLAAAYSSSSQNICVSHHHEQQMNSFDIPNTTVIYNLVDNAFFKVKSKAEKLEKFAFFSLGRQVPQKGIDILLRAFAKLNDQAILRIGGDGTHLQEYQNLASELGINDKVSWLGELDKEQAIEEFQNCDAFVLPSRHESMGIVFAEAMACGKPVIATICGGPEEFICDECGYLVPPEDETELARVMNQMMKKHQLFHSQKIRDHCMDRFSKQVICHQIHNTYLEIIGSNKTN